MINYKIEIYDEEEKAWKDYSRHAIFPVKFSNLLDEQLDEAELQIKNVTKQIFMPLTLVKITFINTPKQKYPQSTFHFDRERDTEITPIKKGNFWRFKEEYSIKMVVASDNTIEKPIGKGKYTHNLYLIELTKVLEGAICDNLVFTNALGNDFIS